MADRLAARNGRRRRSGGSVDGAGSFRDGIDQYLAFDIYETPGYLIRRLQQIVVGLYYDNTAENGVTPVQYAALIAIRRHPGIDQLRLAQIIAFDRSTIGSVLERLEKRGLVRRTTDVEDRRRKSLFLTPEGAALLRQMQPLVRLVQKSCSRLSIPKREWNSSACW
ncbi:MAG: MarR family winged helix-turn-helix transcriptional regulator [Bradyrhizobium sp.]